LFLIREQAAHPGLWPAYCIGSVDIQHSWLRGDFALAVGAGEGYKVGTTYVDQFKAQYASQQSWFLGALGQKAIHGSLTPQTK